MGVAEPVAELGYARHGGDADAADETLPADDRQMDARSRAHVVAARRQKRPGVAGAVREGNPRQHSHHPGVADLPDQGVEIALAERPQDQPRGLDPQIGWQRCGEHGA
jgi:hypothetical protein